MVRPLGEEVVIAWFGPCVNHFVRIDETVEKTHNLRKTNLCRHKADQIMTNRLGQVTPSSPQLPSDTRKQQSASASESDADYSYSLDSNVERTERGTATCCPVQSEVKGRDNEDGDVRDIMSSASSRTTSSVYRTEYGSVVQNFGLLEKKPVKSQL